MQWGKDQTKRWEGKGKSQSGSVIKGKLTGGEREEFLQKGGDL